jgi:tetratricopeptide (TPR) repeat protein
MRAWLAAVGAAVTVLAMPAPAREIHELWDFDDPAASERTFRAELKSAHGDLRLELLTQIARTYGLRSRFDDAHRLLDEIEPQLQDAGPAPRVRYLLERGRTFRSSGAPERARPLFIDAWELARASGLDGLAVDAAHMLALVEAKTDDQLAWNRRALALAERSTQPYAQGWKASLYNNIGWSLHDAGRHEDAPAQFESALRERRRRGRPAETRFARWAVARCLRWLARFDEALRIQRALEAEFAASDRSDGYVFEELAELLEATGKPGEAKAYFARAAAELGKDEWFVNHERARLARLRAKAEER